MTALGGLPLTLTVEQAAELLGVGRSCAYDAVRVGQIPSIRIGRRLLVPRHRLEAMLGLAHHVEGAADKAAPSQIPPEVATDDYFES